MGGGNSGGMGGPGSMSGVIGPGGGSAGMGMGSPGMMMGSPGGGGGMSMGTNMPDGAGGPGPGPAPVPTSSSGDTGPPAGAPQVDNWLKLLHVRKKLMIINSGVQPSTSARSSAKQVRCERLHSVQNRTRNSGRNCLPNPGGVLHPQVSPAPSGVLQPADGGP